MKIRCPVCGKEPLADSEGKPNPFRPFCSGRCRWVDLGKWLEGEYVLEIQGETESESTGRTPESE